MISTVHYPNYYTMLMLKKTLDLTWLYHIDSILEKTKVQKASSCHHKRLAAFIFVFPPPSWITNSINLFATEGQYTRPDLLNSMLFTLHHLAS